MCTGRRYMYACREKRQGSNDGTAYHPPPRVGSDKAERKIPKTRSPMRRPQESFPTALSGGDQFSTDAASQRRHHLRDLHERACAGRPDRRAKETSAGDDPQPAAATVGAAGRVPELGARDLTSQICAPMCVICAGSVNGPRPRGVRPLGLHASQHGEVFFRAPRAMSRLAREGSPSSEGGSAARREPRD